jgi:hypothetical protein
MENLKKSKNITNIIIVVLLFIIIILLFNMNTNKSNECFKSTSPLLLTYYINDKSYSTVINKKKLSNQESKSNIISTNDDMCLFNKNILYNKNNNFFGPTESYINYSTLKNTNNNYYLLTIVFYSDKLIQLVKSSDCKKYNDNDNDKYAYINIQYINTNDDDKTKLFDTMYQPSYSSQSSYSSQPSYSSQSTIILQNPLPPKFHVYTAFFDVSKNIVKDYFDGSLISKEKNNLFNYNPIIYITNCGKNDVEYKFCSFQKFDNINISDMKILDTSYNSFNNLLSNELKILETPFTTQPPPTPTPLTQTYTLTNPIGKNDIPQCTIS